MNHFPGMNLSPCNSVQRDRRGLRDGQFRPHRLLDAVIAALGIKNDAALARALHVSPASLSRIRNGYRVVSADLVLRMHEYGQIPIADLKALLDPGTRLR